MKIIEPSYEILTPINGEEILRTLEKVARTCYKSEDKIGPGTAEKMIHNLISNGHEAMIEFFDITVKFTHNRGFSHELVRHRLCSFAQESTRYCNYSGDKFGNELTMIRPYWMKPSSENDGDSYFTSESSSHWFNAMKIIEDSYFGLLELLKEEGIQPQAQAARGVLPNDLKTEINVKANLREWRTIFKLRTAPSAHPDMRRVMIPLLEELSGKIPVIFDDITLIV